MRRALGSPVIDCMATGLVLLTLATHAQAARSVPASGLIFAQAEAIRSETRRLEATRFPQPVRAGTLVGRALLGPVESQPVLGRVEDIVRQDDGATAVVVRLDGRLGLIWLGLGPLDWPGFGSRLVSVPASAVALMGEYIALLDLSPEGLRALPSFPPGSAPEIPPDTTIQLGIVGPFH